MSEDEKIATVLGITIWGVIFSCVTFVPWAVGVAVIGSWIVRMFL